MKYTQRHVNIYGQGGACVVVRRVHRRGWPSSTAGAMRAACALPQLCVLRREHPNCCSFPFLLYFTCDLFLINFICI